MVTNNSSSGEVRYDAMRDSNACQRATPNFAIDAAL